MFFLILITQCIFFIILFVSLKKDTRFLIKISKNQTVFQSKEINTICDVISTKSSDKQSNPDSNLEQNLETHTPKSQTDPKYAEIEFNKLLFITSNKHKASEAIEIAKIKNVESKFKVISSSDIPLLEEVQEIQDVDIVPVAIDKVKKMYDQIAKLVNHSNCKEESKKLIIVCEDTGLYLEGGYMHGFPGAFFKQFCDTVGNDVCKIHTNGNAIARTAVSVYDGFSVNTFVGETFGTIVSIPQTGNYGFGFDTCFKPHNYTKTFAEMTPQEKNSISMRKIAFGKLFDWIESNDLL
jgi:XTP/dITP diphosphohydrolase